MTIIKTADLTGPALDWAVAKCEGMEMRAWRTYKRLNRVNFSTEWSQGGPIIEREGIAIDCIRCGGKIDGWVAALPMICEASYEECGPTPLVAAMRCYVAAKLDDEVDVPNALST